MKNIVRVGFLMCLFLAFTTSVKAQEKKDSKYKTVELKTSAACHECEGNLEPEIGFSKGVVGAKLTWKTGELTVKYNSKKVTVDEIRKRVAALGYDCDGVKADPKAKNNLGHNCEDHKGHDHH